MTYPEPERLALEVHAMIERQASLRAVLAHRLNDSLTPGERAEIERVIGLIDKEIAELQRRLASIGTGTGGHRLRDCRGTRHQPEPSGGSLASFTCNGREDGLSPACQVIPQNRRTHRV